MCNVTKEMVASANELLARRMAENRHLRFKGGNIVVPVRVFGMMMRCEFSRERINEIYGEALKKARATHGSEI